MKSLLEVRAGIQPPLDPLFVPAVLANRNYRQAVRSAQDSSPMTIAVEQSDDTVSVIETEILPHDGDNRRTNERYIERLVKCLLWQKGGYKVSIAGEKAIADYIKKAYAPDGEREFDYNIIGEKIYGKPMIVEHCDFADAPQENETAVPLGGNLDGCRIGFDLGGSDRKCAAVIDGEVVHSEEITWSPYFEKDPQYHFDGINDSLKSAAEKLPRVDAIGGSAAGVYVNNEVRVASLFRGVPEDLFNSRVRGIFFELKDVWGGVPFDVVNDGEVTALAGSMSMNKNALLGIAMGTSQAAGYVNSRGNITNRLNELAFVPVDYRENAPIDEWSGDAGCGVQYFSQQAVARLCSPAGIDLPASMPLPEKLVEVQKLMESGDDRARKIYKTIGVYFGYAVAHYAELYEIENVLILGRVTSGPGGNIIIDKAGEVLKQEFPEIHGQIAFHMPDEKQKRHGQAIAAAGLPKLPQPVL